MITNGIYADLGTAPDSDQLAMGTWYRSKDTLGGDYPFTQNLLNKKWPLSKGIGFQNIKLESWSNLTDLKHNACLMSSFV